MKYQLVALFDNESHLKVEEIQKQICKRYKLYRNSPTIYISLGVFSNPDIEKLNEVVSKVLNPYKKFKVKINNSIRLAENNKLVNLRVDEKGYILRIARNITDTLELHGFKSISKDNSGLDLSIPLANANYNIKKSCSKSNVVVNNELLPEDHLKFGKIDRIELWRLTSNKRSALVKTFPLKLY